MYLQFAPPGPTVFAMADSREEVASFTLLFTGPFSVPLHTAALQEMLASTPMSQHCWLLQHHCCLHSPRYTGLRFSANAANPSSRSEERNNRE